MSFLVIEYISLTSYGLVTNSEHENCQGHGTETHPSRQNVGVVGNGMAFLTRRRQILRQGEAIFGVDLVAYLVKLGYEGVLDPVDEKLGQQNHRRI